MKDKIKFIIKGTVLERILLSAEIPHNTCLKICIPDGVNMIGTDIFKIDYSKSNITPKDISVILVLPESVEALQPNAFSWKDSYLKSPVVQLEGPGLNSIRYLRSLNSLGISKLKFGKCLEEVSKHSLYGCTKLNILDLSETNIKTLPESFIKYCYGLQDIYLPPTLDSIHPDFIYGNLNIRLHLKSSPIGLDLLAKYKSNIKFYVPYKYYYSVLVGAFPSKTLTMAVKTRVIVDELENNKLNLKYNYRSKSFKVFPNIIEIDGKLFNSYSGDLFIPSHMLVGKNIAPITDIDPYTFCSCKGLNSVSLPYGIDINSFVLDSNIEIVVRDEGK